VQFCLSEGALHAEDQRIVELGRIVATILVDHERVGDVQRLLPKLATYLGHINISGTQRYLTLTPDLLHEASMRFEHYAMEKPDA
jgi:hypothetical protein